MKYPNEPQYGSPDPSYNNLPYQRDNYSTQVPPYYAQAGYDPRAQHSGFQVPPNSFNNYPPPHYDSNNYYGASNAYSNHQQNNYPVPQKSHYYGETSFSPSPTYHPQSRNQYAGNSHGQRQSSNRQYGNDRPGRNDRGNTFRGGRGRGGVNKNYKSVNLKKKVEKKETDSDSDSSISSHASSDS